MAKQLEVSELNRDTLKKCYHQAKSVNMQFEGVVYAKLVLEPIDEITIIFFKGPRHDKEHMEHAIERAHSVYDVEKTYVVDTGSFLM